MFMHVCFFLLLFFSNYLQAMEEGTQGPVPQMQLPQLGTYSLINAIEQNNPDAVRAIWQWSRNNSQRIYEVLSERKLPAMDSAMHIAMRNFAGANNERIRIENRLKDILTAQQRHTLTIDHMKNQKEYEKAHEIVLLLLQTGMNRLTNINRNLDRPLFLLIKDAQYDDPTVVNTILSILLHDPQFNFNQEVVQYRHDGNRYNLLEFAIVKNFSSIAELLIKNYGFNPVQQDANGLNGLHHAVAIGSIDMIRTLIQNTPPQQRVQILNAVSNDNQTPLQFAIALKNRYARRNEQEDVALYEKIVDMLQQYKAKFNA